MGYCTDLTDKQWQVIENLLDGKERKHKHSLRSTAFSFKKYCSSLAVFPRENFTQRRFHFPVPIVDGKALVGRSP